MGKSSGVPVAVVRGSTPLRLRDARSTSWCARPRRTCSAERPPEGGVTPRRLRLAPGRPAHGRRPVASRRRVLDRPSEERGHAVLDRRPRRPRQVDPGPHRRQGEAADLVRAGVDPLRRRRRVAAIRRCSSRDRGLGPGADVDDEAGAPRDGPYERVDGVVHADEVTGSGRRPRSCTPPVASPPRTRPPRRRGPLAGAVDAAAGEPRELEARCSR